MLLSACTLDCPGTCSLILQENNGVPNVKGNPSHPFTKGLICTKGKAHLKRINHPERITTPLLKQGNEFQPISWDQAFDLCTEKIKALHPEQILHIKGYGYRGVLAKASSVLFRSLGALKTYGSLCDEAGCEAVIKNFGSLAQNHISDLDNSDIIINWGRDLTRSSIHLSQIIKDLREKGKQVISISPGGDGNEKLSDQCITIHPGTDRFLAAAIIKMLLAEGKIEKTLADKCDGLSELKKILNGYEIHDLAAICQVDLHTIVNLFNIYKSSKNISSLIGWGVQRYISGGENVRFITALCALSGKMGSKGNGFYYNISSGRNFASWAKPTDTSKKQKIFLLNLEQELNSLQKKVKFIWIDGMNVANQVPDAISAARAIEECDFTVTVDAFMNDTAMRSNLILPCALPLERDDLLGSSMHNVVAWAGKVLKPKGEAKSDFEIISELGYRLFETTPIPAADECLKKAIQTPHINASLNEIKEQGFIEANWPEIAYENNNFAHADGKFKLPQHLTPEPESGEGFKLLTLVRKNFIHSQIPSEKQDGLPELYLSSSSKAGIKFKDGDKAQLCTSKGKIPVTIRLDDSIHHEAAIMRRGGWMKHGQCPNTIISPAVTDMGCGAAYYSQNAWIEPIDR